MKGASIGLVIFQRKWTTPLHCTVLITGLVINMINGPIFTNFMGQLDKSGKAKAKFTMFPVQGAAGIHITFAYALDKPFDYTSNPVEILITP